MSPKPIDRLTADERDQLSGGFHHEVAAALRARDAPDLAGWVLEQIWDWPGAIAEYRRSDRRLDVLRVALESGEPRFVDDALARLEAVASPDEIDAAIALLKRRRRAMEAARLLALRNDPRAQARALVRAGDRLGAARALAEAGHAKEALDALRKDGTLKVPAALSLASRLAWDLGDAEGAARFAQRSLRAGADDADVVELLARALGTLGHHLAAQVVLGDRNLSAGAPVPGRYRVTGVGTTVLIGATYLGIDRATLAEVEVHLLLAEHGDGLGIDPAIAGALEAFTADASAASALGHPAIRPILRADAAAGLLVTPRPDGPTLRSLIRVPGMWKMLPRARALAAFLLEGLQAAHARGVVHGWPLPSLIVCDAIGRPMLGPFGAHHLAGLTSTHTGGLEEIMAISAPELATGGAPTVQTDVFAIGALLGALLVGSLSVPRTRWAELAENSTPELELALAMTASEPQQRPSIDAALSVLRQPVADVRELRADRGRAEAAERSSSDGAVRDVTASLVVTAHDSWDDETLDALAQRVSPWFQPILDREDRAFVLAAWPHGCRALGDDAEAWERLVPDGALDLGAPGLEAALRRRLRPASLVRTPAGAWMLALDDILTR